GEAVVAVSVRSSVDPSGSVKLRRIFSPGAGFAPMSTVMAAGAPAGPVTVAPVREELTLDSLKPKGWPGASSAIATALEGKADVAARPKFAAFAVPVMVMPSVTLPAVIAILPPAPT